MYLDLALDWRGIIPPQALHVMAVSPVLMFANEARWLCIRACLVLGLWCGLLRMEMELKLASDSSSSSSSSPSSSVS